MQSNPHRGAALAPSPRFPLGMPGPWRHLLALLLVLLGTLGGVAPAWAAKTPTTTALASSVNPSYVGQSTTLTATVTPSAATGTVTFKDGNTTLGSATLSAGVATLSTSFASAGAHSLTANYAGTSTYASSSSSALSQTVNAKAATTTALGSSVNPSYASQSTTLSATVTPSSATGSVTFKDGTTTLGSGTLSAGVATLSTSFAATGSHSLTAVYAGDVANNTSTSSALSQTVNAKTNSSTALSSSVNPSYVGQSTTLTATVTGTSPSGSVTFKDGTTTLGSGTLSAGVATLSTSFAATGSHSLTAVYAGDVANNASTSSALSQTVNAKTNSSTALASSVNPSAIGQSTTLTATVTGTSPSGSVTFMDGTTTLGNGTLSAGVATLSTSFASAGAHSLSAVYGGDAANNASTSSALSQSVTAIASATALASSANPVALGQSTTLSATVSPSAATGTVTFKDGTATLGSGTLSGGVASFAASFGTTGTHSLSAVYSGDASYATSTSGALSQSVTAASTTLLLSATPDTVVSGNAVTLSATLSGSAPTGNIVFSDGGTAIATVAVSTGQAATTQTLTTTGLHSLTASYAGDANNLASVSNAVGVQVAASGSSGSTPGPMTWLYGYDPQGNPWIEIDPRGKETNRNYDSLNRATQIIRPAPAGSSAPTTIGMSYDGQDNLSSVTDSRSLATTYTVDGLKNVKVQASPDTGSTNATFDAAGNVLSRTDSRGKVTTYTYDALNRMTVASYASGTPTVFEYDGGTSPGPNSAGRLTKITDESGTTSYSYDAQGRVLTKTQLVGTKTLVLSYTWGTTGSATGSLTSLTYPSGSRVNYSYDAFGRVSAVSVNPVNANGVGTNTGSTINVLSAVAYNAENNLAGWTWSDATVVQRGFDAFGRLASYPLGNPGGTGIAAGLLRTLSYDDAGRITGYTHTRAGVAQTQYDQGFTYDDLGQLATTTQSTTSYGYSYDASGNRTLRVVGGSSYALTVAATSNRLMQAQSAGGTISFGYDNAGNMLADGVASYTYSDRGRMGSATLGANTVVYKYNGLDQRVSKSGPTALVSTGAAYYAYDEAGRLVGEYDANLSPIYETVYLGSTPVAVLKQTGSAQSSTLQVSSYNVWADHIDTPRVVTRSTDQAIVWRWDTAEAFGASAPDQNPSALGTFAFNQRFPGQLLDAETGNFYNWHRDYNPAIGRYVQSDPIGLQGGINTFAYVDGSPLNTIDPQGLMGGGGFSASQSHHYEIHMPLCEGCTLTDGLNAMRAFSAPGAPYAQDGTRRLILAGGNPILQTVDPCAHTITNVTQPGHFFAGTVAISINNNNGVVGVDIVGSGVGQNAAINSIVGPVLFSAFSFGAYLSLHPDFGTFP